MCYKKLLTLRFWGYSGGAVSTLCAGLVTYPYFFPDTAYEEYLASYTKARALADEGRMTSLFDNKLGKDRVECVHAITALLALQLQPRIFNDYFAPRVVFEDSLMILDGLAEVKDGWYFLQHFFAMTSPVVTEVRQSITDPEEIHLRYSTDAMLRFIPISYTFNSSMELNLGTFGTKKKIVNARHRWYEGAIFSRRSGSLDTIAGDFGDLMRRWNGFWLSSFLTASTYVSHAPEDGGVPPSTIKA